MNDLAFCGLAAKEADLVQMGAGLNPDQGREQAQALISQDWPPLLTHSRLCDAVHTRATTPPPTASAAHVSWKLTITSQCRARRAQLASAKVFAACSSPKEYDQPTAPVDRL